MKELRKYYRIKGTPQELYTALVNPFSISLWTGRESVMKEEEGSEFSIFGGEIAGRNLQFEKDHKIVQEWYFGERQEQSIVTITLRPDRHFTKLNSIIPTFQMRLSRISHMAGTSIILEH